MKTDAGKELTNAIEKALDGHGILFTGSGFSYGAKNVKGMPVKTGVALKQHFCDLKKLPYDYQLSEVANYFIDNTDNGEDLMIKILKEEFTIKDVTESHETVMSIPWRRVYTTNYDHVVEIAARKNGIVYNPVTMSSPFEDPAQQSACIHINGSIEKCDHYTLRNEFKLTDISYNIDEMHGKPWFDFMESDFKAADVIFVIGFSLSQDLDITRILYKPAFRGKIVFIDKPDLDLISKNRFNSCGKVYDIGIDGFKSAVQQVKKKYVEHVTKEQVFKSFATKENFRSVMKPSFIQLVSFYTFGKCNDNILQKDSYGNYSYISARHEIDTFLSYWRTTKVFLITSRLGNGKTILCQMIKNELEDNKIDVFMLEEQQIDIEREISAISSLGKRCVVIIDDYYKYLEVLQIFGKYNSSKVVFVLTSRWAMHLTHESKLLDALHIEKDNITLIQADKLKKEELHDLALRLIKEDLIASDYYGKEAGKVAEIFFNKCHAEMAEIILDLYSNEDNSIRIKLQELLKDAIHKEGNHIYYLSVLALLNEYLKLKLSLSDMLGYLRIEDKYIPYEHSQLLNELFDFKNDEIRFRSSIVGRELLLTVIDSESLFTVLRMVAEYADRESYKFFNQELLKAIVSHDSFQYMVSKRKSKIKDAIFNYYEKIRSLDFYKNNPFFWEEYALVCIDFNEFPAAKQCINNAYSGAKLIPYFVPFQICAVEAVYILSNLLFEKGKNTVDEITDQAFEARDKLFLYYDHKDNNHNSLFRIAKRFLGVYDLFNGLNPSASQRDRFSNLLSSLQDRFNKFKAEENRLMSGDLEKFEKDLENKKNDNKPKPPVQNMKSKKKGYERGVSRN